MKFRVRYRRARVTVEGFRPKNCAACGVRGRVELHHWKYAYTTAEVRKNPQLALKFTIPFCYKHHKIADYIRRILKDPEGFHLVMIALSYDSINKMKEALNV